MVKEIYPYIGKTYKVYTDSREEADEICEIAGTGLYGVNKRSDGSTFGWNVVIREEFIEDVKKLDDEDIND